MRTEPISNGMLLAMTPQRRTETIADLSGTVRRRLANIAALGAAREIEKAVEQLDTGHHSWHDQRLAHGKALTSLAAELTGDDAEKKA